MKRQQIPKGNIVSLEKEGRKSNTSSKISIQRNRTGDKNLIRKTGSRSVSPKEEVWEYSSNKILKACKDLKSVCMRIDNLEKEKQKLLDVVLKDVPRKRKMHI